MQRNVYLCALALALFLAVTVAVPVVVLDIPTNEDGTPDVQPTTPSDANFELIDVEQRTVPRRDIESGENANGVTDYPPTTDSTVGETNIRGYCRCYEIVGGYELCVTVVFEQTEDGEIIERKRRFVRSISSK